MVSKAIAALTVALALVLAACSVQREGRGGQESAPPSASAPASSSAVATTTSSSVDTTRDVCRLVDTAASDQLLAAALAISGTEKGRALRVAFAATYSGFAERLSQIAPQAPGNLRSALTDWALASTEVAQFVVDNEPGPGIVVDLGPAHPRWQDARKAIENICGHPLPNN